MKPNFLYRCAVLGIGAAMLFTATTTRADEPKRKRHATTTDKSGDGRSVTPAKATTRSGKIPTEDGRNSTSAEGGEVGGANGRETRVPTGSHIPQTYNRRGYTTDRGDNTFIYDSNDLRLRRTDNVSDSLRTIPGVTIRGMR